MTWVKVCGLTAPGLVDVALDAGADAVGVVLAEGSPRRVDRRTAAALVERAAGRAILVATEADERLVDDAVTWGALGIQPHGTGGRDLAVAGASAGLFVLAPFAVGPRTDTASVARDVGELPEGVVPLFDAYDPVLAGGTGRLVDPGRLPRIPGRWVLAGGLDPRNVADRIRRLDPWGVDASSGLESSPGVKDPDAIVRFVEEAKSA